MQVNNLENEVKILNTNVTHIDNVIDKEELLVNESLKLLAEINNALEDVSKESVKTKKFISNTENVLNNVITILNSEFELKEKIISLTDQN